MVRKMYISYLLKDEVEKMVTITQEITKEEYEQYKDTPGKLGQKYISLEEYMGYGVYAQRIYEDNGKYIFSYERGSSCD